jgi:hypothetical protein
LDGLEGPLDDLQIPTAQLEPPSVDGRDQSQDEILHSGSLQAVQGLAFQALSVPVLHAQQRLVNSPLQ